MPANSSRLLGPTSEESLCQASSLKFQWGKKYHHQRSEHTINSIFHHPHILKHATTIHMSNYFHRARFIRSAFTLDQLAADIGYEVAFVGRSNAGKSSAINAMTAKRNLAKTSKTPGRTQSINIFALDEQRRIIDLPGYGYAKAPKRVSEHWQKLLPEYLLQRASLKGLILVSDVRHPLQQLDQKMLNYCRQAALPVHILLTKTDKLSRGAAANIQQQVAKELRNFDMDTTIQLFSATKFGGIDELRTRLETWLAVHYGGDREKGPRHSL